MRNAQGLLPSLVQASAIPLPGVTPPPGQIAQVNTHTIVVKNTGKKTANNVRIGHYVLPPSHQVFPPVSYEVVNAPTPNTAAEIVIPNTLVPDEQVSITYLYFPPVTWDHINSYAKSDECMAKIINIIISEQLNKTVIFLLWSLIFVGASTLIYWLFFVVAGWLK